MVYSVKIQDMELNDYAGRAVTGGLDEINDKTVTRFRTPRGDVFQIRRESEPSYRFMGVFTGANAETDLNSLKDFLEKQYPLYFKFDQYESWIAIDRLSHRELPGSTSGDKAYEYQLELTEIGKLSRYKRTLRYNYEQIDNDFNLDGEIVAPLTVGASPVRETVDFYRTTAAGSIPCIHLPELDLIPYTITTQANMNLTRPQAYWDSTSGHFILENGLIKIESRHGEASNKDRWDVYIYDGSAWVKVSELYFYLNDINNSGLEAPSEPPSVWLVSDHLLYKRVKFAYPSTTNYGYNLAGIFETWYGKPFIKMQVGNYGQGPTLGEVRYTLGNASFQYYTNGVDGTLDASTHTDGWRTTTGDSDTVNHIELHSENPISNTTVILGMARLKQADCNYMANDAGTTWSNLAFVFDNLTLTGETPAPEVWLFAQKQSVGGNRTPEQLSLEALMELTMEEVISKVI